MDTLQTPDRHDAQPGQAAPTGRHPGATAALPFRFREVQEGGPEATRAGVEAAAAASFDAVLLPCPYETRHGLLWDAGRAGAAYGGGPIGTAAALVGALRAACPALTLFADLPIDGVANLSPLHRLRAAYFLPPDTSGVLDPRRSLDLKRAVPLLDGDASIGEYAALLAGAAASFANAGIGGIRLRDLKRLPGDVVATIVRAIRARAPDLLLVGDTPGTAWDRLGRLDAGLFDFVVASSAWWNWSDPWLFEEIRILRRIAPVLLPLSPVGATGADTDGLARNLGLAAAIGGGWILGAAATGDAAGGAASRFNAAFAAPPLAGLMPRAEGMSLLSDPAGRVLRTLRTPGADVRRAAGATIALLNRDLAVPATIDPASLLPVAQGTFGRFERIFPVPAAADPASTLVPGNVVTLPPGALALYRAERLPARAPTRLSSDEVARSARSMPRLGLENPTPAVDGGAFPVKRIAGEFVEVGIDIIGDGHDKLGAAVQWREPGADTWQEKRLTLVGNDRWTGGFPLATVGLHHWRVVAWYDEFASFRDELAKKWNAGVPIALELREGAALVGRVLGDDPASAALIAAVGQGSEETRKDLLLADETNALMVASDPRHHATHSAEIPLDAERSGAGFAAWYEVFPRSMSDDPSRHGTFRDVERHLPRIRDMGFDVLYFPPIHPIGRTNRKGPNNTLTPSDTDPGSPYAIGAADGGHEALHAELGSFEDFAHLIEAAAEHGLEIAIDFAIQCSPDHPWLREHKGWFNWRPDGTIKYAENPPKKYQDIVNVDFYAGDAIPGLWQALAESVLFWCDKGVRLFRVDNPHTKAFPFWEWMIREVRTRHPDAVFLAEAFTRPKIMQRLGKIGFSQSYTYFTWRNTKSELREYLVELADGPMRDYYRPHFFVNTPDINPFFLQRSGRPGFLIRAALAATLSGLWGVYNGFELCEGTPLAEGKEEYLDSEKFQLRAWDWDRPGNIASEIAQLNAIRRANPALHSQLGIEFLESSNEGVLWYAKATPDRGNVLLIGVSLDPYAPQTSALEVPLWRYGVPDHGSIAVEDLVSGARFDVTGKYQTVTFEPALPYLIWRLPGAH